MLLNSSGSTDCEEDSIYSGSYATYFAPTVMFPALYVGPLTGRSRRWPTMSPALATFYSP